MPLSFDMPFEDLVQYQGINPKPDDFDAYWTKALEDMRSVDPALELVPADFQADGCDCFHLYFNGVGGARMHAKYLRPNRVKEAYPALLLFHGYTGSSRDWMDKLAYVSQGFSVAALDCRGQGGLSEDLSLVSGNTHHGHIIRGLSDALAGAPEKLLYRQIFLDTAQLANIVMNMPEVDATRVGAAGASQGGALTLACAALEPRIKRAVPVYPFLSDYKRVWEIDLAAEAYLELREFFRLFDPRHLMEDAVFQQLGYIDIQNLAPRIEAEILWGIGLMDTICPPSTQFAAYNKIKSVKSMEIYPDYGHESLLGFYDLAFQFLRGL